MAFDPKLCSYSGNAEYETVRRWPRYHVDVRVAATFRKAGKIVTQRGWGTDISQGGMAVYLACDLVLGEEIELELVLPYSASPIRVVGAVRNRDGFRYGIEFTLITTDQQGTIERTCSALALMQ